MSWIFFSNFDISAMMSEKKRSGEKRGKTGKNGKKIGGKQNKTCQKEDYIGVKQKIMEKPMNLASSCDRDNIRHQV